MAENILIMQVYSLYAGQKTEQELNYCLLVLVLTVKGGKILRVSFPTVTDSLKPFSENSFTA